MTRLFFTIIIFSLFSSLLTGQTEVKKYNKENDNIDGPPQRPDLSKTTGIADEAVGVLDKGQLQNLTMNYGQISDTRYEDRGNAPTQSFFNFRYPRSNWTSLIDDFSFLFALPDNTKNGNNGNVIDGYTENDNEDWQAKDGSYGATHYNPATDPSPESEILYPPDNPITPYLAHSDLPATWPVDENGDRFWPGYFRRDPDTGDEMEGEFVSDRDVYAVFTDASNQLGNPIGLEVEMMAYSYGRPYADKFQFYEFFIHNKSGRKLDSCYVGYYGDPDCSDYGEETFIVPDALFNNPDVADVIMNRDFDGDIGGATQPNNVGKVEDESFGIAILETPQDMGVSTFHYFQDTGPVADKVLWPIISSNPDDKDVSSFKSSYFHGANKNIDDTALLTLPQDLVYIVASGPFSLEPDEMVKSTIVVAVGDNDADFFSQINQAVDMYKLGFVGPAAPPAPNLAASGISDGDAEVTLYWDDISESAKDPFTGDEDFEGYKIYRSEDNGQTWGDEVRDAKGSLIGYVPIAQFDLENFITGFDPRNPVSFLGDDTGIKHTYTDKTVKYGIRYSYTVVAYDQGDEQIYSLESSRGTAITDRNFVTVTPSPAHLGKIPGQITNLEQISGNGKGDLSFNIINDGILNEDIYEVHFNGDPATSFKLVNIAQGDTLAYNLPMNNDDNAVIDGFQIVAESEGKIGGAKYVTDGFGKNVLGNANIDSSGSWFVSIAEFATSSLEGRSHDFEIRFVESGDVAYSWGAASTSTAAFETKIEIWDVTTGINQKVCFEVQDNNNNQQWDEGETIFVLQALYPEPQIGDPLPAVFPDDFPYQVIISNSPSDGGDNPPQQGDMVQIDSYRSLNSADVFSFSVQPPTTDNTTVDLSEVRVVPNPYIVGAAWEELQNVHQIRFMFLPQECTINIYTINGEKVKTIKHKNGGDEMLNLVNENDQALAFGVYVYVVTTPDGKKQMNKFAIIR